MKRLCVLSTLAFTFLALAGAPGRADSASDPVSDSDFVPAKLVRKVDPIFPYRLSSEGVFSGRVLAMLEIDFEGKVDDWLALETTSEFLIEAIDAVIDRWEFEPARLNGEAVPIGCTIEIRFTMEGVIMHLNAMQMTNAFFNSQRRVENNVYLVPFSKLDAIPTPIEVVRPLLYAEIPEDKRTGEVVFTFLIDREGRVRMPVMTYLEGDPRLAESAYIALKKWRFDSPKVDGDNVIVEVSQRFVFTP